MNTLHQFLLDTARQDWETWYGYTRLVFADWLEEAPRYDSARAKVLRLLMPDITDPSLERAHRHCRRDVLAMFADGWVRINDRNTPAVVMPDGTWLVILEPPGLSPGDMVYSVNQEQAAIQAILGD